MDILPTSGDTSDKGQFLEPGEGLLLQRCASPCHGHQGQAYKAWQEEMDGQTCTNRTGLT